MPADCDQSSSGESGSDGSWERSHETRTTAELFGSNEANGVFVHGPIATGHMVMEKPLMLTHGMDVGMEYWSNPAVSTGHEALKPQYVLAPAGTMPFNGEAKGSGKMWLQDDKQQRREKRKQANRESARRSRMRKQFEYEELAEKVAALTAENDSLRSEVNRLGDLYRKLSSEKDALLERVHKGQS
ncbi:hypothetical protein GOP47_0004272 [Adiantum capillus-veneris]|uniref:BZIP domain-containing protein n=1 Tax=Adiantum capillus-veneris TaxID=13818 RepID=A0A9D4V794_ADICA|nr:hypothetical protein GOP47_0004272 [Adiantum capillus-veneris]